MNSTWRSENEQNVRRFFDASGSLPPGEVDAAAAAIYKSGIFSGASCFASFVAFRAIRSKNLERQYKDMPQLTWDQVGHFIFKRFGSYPEQKLAHLQWDVAGHGLWQMWKSNADDESAFMKAFLRLANS